MARVKRGVTSHAKHKKILKAAKGYYGRRKNTIRIAKQAVEKANQYAFRDRKRRKRTFRALWIQRLNAAVRPFGINYSRFIAGLDKAGITIDRKVLSDLAIHEPAAFEAIVGEASSLSKLAVRFVPSGANANQSFSLSFSGAGSAIGRLYTGPSSASGWAGICAATFP